MNDDIKPYSQACENNKQAILNVLKQYLKDKHSVLEIGSGTGQHAVYFALNLPSVTWQPSELVENISGLNIWIGESGLQNIKRPIVLDVNEAWSLDDAYDTVFSANTAHIISWSHVQRMLKKVAHLLEEKGYFFLYGPFNYQGCFTSESNARFDQWLKTRDVNSGVRNFEDIDQVARSLGLCLLADHEMPANNRMLVWHKR